MQFESWIAFCSIALIATATPGPAVFLVSLHTVSFGLGKSFFTILGNVSGLFIMSALSVSGLSTLILHSAFAFTLVKLLGAVYLVYMGVKCLTRRNTSVALTSSSEGSGNRLNLFLQGLLVAVTNPKAIIFTTALFPQFLSLSEPLAIQFSLLVLSFMSLSFICLGSYALLALKSKAKSSSILPAGVGNKIAGISFIGAGLSLALASK